MDTSPVTDRLPAVSVGRLGRAFVYWMPGLKQDAPKRNFVLLIAYLELLLFAASLLQNVT